jgi:hypothetical protein
MKPLERQCHSNIDTKTQSGDTGSRWLRSNSPLAPQPYSGLPRQVLSPWVLDLPSSQNVALVNAAAASMMVSATGLSSFPPPFDPPVSRHCTVPNMLPPKPKRFSLPSCSSKFDLALAAISLKFPSSSPTVFQSPIPSARLHLRAAFSCRSLAFSLFSLLTVSDKLPLADCNLVNSSCSASRRADDSLMVSSFRARNAL